jgi:hypothetical protein
MVKTWGLSIISITSRLNRFKTKPACPIQDILDILSSIYETTNMQKNTVCNKEWLEMDIHAWAMDIHPVVCMSTPKNGHKFSLEQKMSMSGPGYPSPGMDARDNGLMYI